jgi:hypothetical protein
LLTGHVLRRSVDHPREPAAAAGLAIDIIPEPSPDCFRNVLFSEPMNPDRNFGLGVLAAAALIEVR